MELSCASTVSLPTLLPNRTPIARSPPLLLLHRPKPLTFPTTTGLRCRASEETSTFVSQFDRSPIGTAADKAEDIQVELVSSEKEEKEKDENENGKEELPGGDIDQSGPAEFLNKLGLKLDSDDTYSILIYGTGALVALWLSSAVVGTIDSIPVFPKVMEVVGLAYTVWFSYQYLIFKKNREELFAKIEDLKEQIIGTSDG